MYLITLRTRVYFRKKKIENTGKKSREMFDLSTSRPKIIISDIIIVYVHILHILHRRVSIFTSFTLRASRNFLPSRNSIEKKKHLIEILVNSVDTELIN